MSKETDKLNARINELEIQVKLLKELVCAKSQTEPYIVTGKIKTGAGQKVINPAIDELERQWREKFCLDGLRFNRSDDQKMPGTMDGSKLTGHYPGMVNSPIGRDSYDWNWSGGYVRDTPAGIDDIRNVPGYVNDMNNISTNERINQDGLTTISGYVGTPMAGQNLDDLGTKPISMGGQHSLIGGLAGGPMDPNSHADISEILSHVRVGNFSS